ncbi:two-component system sensor histidine kinase CssS [Breznakia sp. PF5-3]|uniref:HAMP domain-containing sensor histidine kinase n=2 Tax=Breznakia TaxID=1854458 RepID=UPI00240745DF|nr:MULTISPECIES: HAMP domain-containing sensor histidine kinase [unclassified Breznakia]MDF9825444.1 two-component system sensor histidine kinase CssS [Breznakia sp. PM6-1]MDF9836322.1 two-component system sensor histidine kinase CssS [Breznakia sp. PF5-3]MDF9838553.1 two-component system sensor histidine kinase CssS [Breznakia sp. PFB2-8]MDF9860563.1 two-component system sensor histidine kinase CssS [Breznakia sp. PH5-24]
MPKSRLWVKNLSLSQQLFVLIVSFISFFAIFFFIFINSNVNRYTEEQMFIQLREVQNNLTYFYGLDVNINELSQGDYRFVDTYFFEKEADTFTVISNSNDLQEGSGIYTDIYKNIQVLSAISEGPVGTFYKNVSIDYSFSSKKYTYYSIKFLDDDVIMVSMLDNDYMEEFKSTFVGNVMDITIFVVGLFFVIMMLWVSNIIRPLNQIKNYIEKVKVGKDAKINVHRRDEIGEVATALVSMREELTRQESTKEEMIHNISHDLKTPIATIKSYGESIKDGIYPYDTLEKSVDVIIDNANRLEKKVHSLLFMNRVEYILSQDNEEVYCDMKEVVSTVVLNTKVIRPEIEIETNLTTSLFRGNDEAWRVCVENILENALRYAKSQIVITLDEDQLCIYNDGPQIEEERLKVLFKPYEKGEGGQFGLGLSIVSKVVQASHYQIVAENVETEGVIFKIMK